MDQSPAVTEVCEAANGGFHVKLAPLLKEVIASFTRPMATLGGRNIQERVAMLAQSHAIITRHERPSK
jgi:hypothetical protein